MKSSTGAIDSSHLDLSSLSTFIINLDESRQRWMQCVRRLTGLIDPRCITRVPAINGLSFSNARQPDGWDEGLKRQLVAEGYLGESDQGTLDPVRAAVCLSHQRALKMFLEGTDAGSDDDRWALILEDDATPAQLLLNLVDTCLRLPIPPNSDVLFLHDRVVGMDLDLKKSVGAAAGADGMTWRVATGGIGLEAYLVSAKGARKMLAAWKPLLLECDIQLMAFMEHSTDHIGVTELRRWKPVDNEVEINGYVASRPLFQVDELTHSVKEALAAKLREDRDFHTGNVDPRGSDLTFDLINPMAFATCWFNPAHFRSRLENFLRFMDRIRPCNLLVVELAIGEDDWQLPDDTPNLVRLRSDTICWQKEALLNYGMGLLASRAFPYIGWLDADIVFDDETWQPKVIEVLQKRSLCQVFESVETTFPDRGIEVGMGAAAAWLRNTVHPLACDNPGFGWAMTRDLWTECQLYDFHVLGGGDGVMWRSIFYECFDRNRLYARDAYPESMAHVRDAWARRWSRRVNMQVGAPVGVRLTALPHGYKKNRQYTKRGGILKKHGFDPAIHCKRGPSGLIEWEGCASETLRECVKSYFIGRREDD